MNVLIVDDSKELRIRLQRIISNIKDIDKVYEAASTQSSIDIIRTTPLDIVILDISIPGKGGFYVLKQIKKEKPEIMVFMFTNYPFVGFKKMSKVMGADYFYYKPDFKEMISVLKRIKK